MIQVDPSLAGFKLQVELGRVPPEIAINILFGILNLADVDPSDTEMTIMLKKSDGLKILDFDHYSGGDIFIVEKLQDLTQIVGILPADRRDDPSNMTAPIDEGGYVFDVAEDYGKWVLLCLITNNSGGNMYFVPQHLKASCVYIQMAIKEASNDRNG
jgi:hypothetical protein